jgi:hypothetical protein
MPLPVRERSKARLLFLLLRLAAVAGIMALILCGSAVVAAEKWECWKGSHKVIRNLSGIHFTFTPTKDEDAMDWPGCHVMVQDAAKKVILAEDDAAFTILDTRLDWNGDGKPDLILKAYSGGAHCCWTFYFISPGPNARLMVKLENQRDADFLQDEKTGKPYLAIEDGAFDYFDGLCHACTPFPEVFLRIEGNRFVDVHSEHMEEYDGIVQDNRKALTTENIKQVVSMKTNPSETESPVVRESVRKILLIVFAYLYSGREDQARRELQAMWPLFDRDRMWNLILEHRREGILRYVQRAPDMPSAPLQQ